MKVLVTGIDGFVGSHAAEYLLTIPSVEIHGTIIAPRAGENVRHMESRLTLHQADILDEARMDAVVSAVRPDRIIHLAGQAFVPVALKDPVTTFRTNIFGGIAVLEAAARLARQTGQRPSVLVVSTGEVYGRVDPERQPISEEFPLNPGNPYAASKASIDLIAQQYRSAFGVDVVIARPFNHAGSRQSPTFVCSDFGKQFAAIGAGKSPAAIRVGNPDVKRDFTDVRDVVRAYWQLFERHSQEFIFNVCSGRAVRIRDMVALFSEVTGIQVRLVTEEHRVRTADLPVMMGSFDRLARATGWHPAIPLRQTLHDVYDYWQHAIQGAS